MREKKKNPSLSTRKNLWHSKTEERKYSRELRKLVGQFGAELQEALKRASHTDVTGKTTIDLAAFQQELARIEQNLLNNKGAAVTKEHAKASMLLGIRHADRSMREAGIDDSQS